MQIDIIKEMIRKGRSIFPFPIPIERIATYSESPDIRPRQKIVEKKTEIGTAMGIKVVITFPIIPRMKKKEISSDETSVMILKSSKVIRKEIKKTVLTIKGIIKFDAI